VYKYLESLEKFGINLGLERITCLLSNLGNPQQKFKSIHIAGTNGKGSTAAMIASILAEAGYKVGLYTSPHLFDYRERIKINGKDISKKDFQEGLELIKKLDPENEFSDPQKSKKRINSLFARREPRIYSQVCNQPTIFEVLTAVAFWYFAKKKVDYAVVEVGMGGRLDATNVITPLVSVITNIDYEHTEVLGKTLGKIAAEKAAIIRPGVPVVTAETKPQALGVIKRTAKKQGTVLVGVSGKLRGGCQALNTACALSAILVSGIKVSKSAIKRGLQKVNWPGRFQIVSKKPLIMVDGAHNPAGAKALRVMIKEMIPNKFTVIFGCQQTKDYQNFIKELKPVISNLIITKSSHKQAADPVVISKKLKAKLPIHIAHSISEAILRWDKKTPLLITGSLFLVADALKLRQN